MGGWFKDGEIPPVVGTPPSEEWVTERQASRSKSEVGRTALDRWVSE